MNKLILIDRKQANKAYDTMKNDLYKRPSVITDTKDILEEEIITEGLTLFKTSPKLYKFSEKILAKSRRPNLNEIERKRIEDASREIRLLAKNFEQAELYYSIGKKTQARMMEKELKRRYFKTLKILKKSENIDALKKAGGFATFLSSMVLPYVLLNKFFPTLSFGAVNTAAAKEASIMKQIGMYFKRAGAFTICRIPTTTATNLVNNKLTKNDEKLLRDLTK